MSLLTFLTYTYRLSLVRILDCLVHYIDHVIRFFVRGLVMRLLAVGSGGSLEHFKGAYLVVLWQR